MTYPRIVGHRGAAALAPENTLAGFRKAAEAGAEMVELDAKLSADGIVICHHDNVLGRTSTGEGPVAEQSFAALRALDAGNGQRIGPAHFLWGQKLDQAPSPAVGAAPAITTARAVGLASSSRRVCCNPSRISFDKALSLAGRLKVRVRTSPSRPISRSLIPLPFPCSPGPQTPWRPMIDSAQTF